MPAVNAIGSVACASTPCVQPRRNDMASVLVAKTPTSMSGRLLAMTRVLVPMAVRLLSPARLIARPTSEWQRLSTDYPPIKHRLNTDEAQVRRRLLPPPSAPGTPAALHRGGLSAALCQRWTSAGRT